MAYFRHGDPLDDFNRLDAEQAKRREALPKCGICGEPIQDEYCYEINGKKICQVCLDNHYKVDVDTFNEI